MTITRTETCLIAHGGMGIAGKTARALNPNSGCWLERLCFAAKSFYLAIFAGVSLLGFSVASSRATPPQSPGDTLTVPVAEDIFKDVQDPLVVYGPHGDGAYGNGTIINWVYHEDATLMDGDITPARDIKTAIKFNLSEITGYVGAAKLRIYIKDAINPVINFWGSFDDSWSEAASYFPATTNVSLGRFTSIPLGAWLEIDVTSFIKNQLAGDQVATFVLEADAAGADSLVAVESNEDPNNPPQLEILFALPPQTNVITSEVGASSSFDFSSFTFESPQVITDFRPGTDKIDVSLRVNHSGTVSSNYNQVAGFNDILILGAHDSGEGIYGGSYEDGQSMDDSGTFIRIDNASGGDSGYLYLPGTTASQFSRSDFIFDGDNVAPPVTNVITSQVGSNGVFNAFNFTFAGPQIITGFRSGIDKIDLSQFVDLSGTFGHDVHQPDNHFDNVLILDAHDNGDGTYAGSYVNGNPTDTGTFVKFENTFNSTDGYLWLPGVDSSLVSSNDFIFASTNFILASSLFANANPGSSTWGQAVDLRVYANGYHSSAIPAGDIIFFDGATPLSTNAIAHHDEDEGFNGAIFTTSTLSAGEHTLRFTFAGDTNFFGSTNLSVFTVTRAPLTIAANDTNKVYGAAVPTLSASFTGFVNGDTTNSLDTQPQLSTSADAGSHVIGNPYAISVGGATNSNYAISYIGGSLTVTPGALTITAGNQTKLYAAAVPTFSASFAGFLNDDTTNSLNSQPTLNTSATAASHLSGSPFSITATMQLILIIRFPTSRARSLLLPRPSRSRRITKPKSTAPPCRY